MFRAVRQSGWLLGRMAAMHPKRTLGVLLQATDLYRALRTGLTLRNYSIKSNFYTRCKILDLRPPIVPPFARANAPIARVAEGRGISLAASRSGRALSLA